MTGDPDFQNETSWRPPGPPWMRHGAHDKRRHLSRRYRLFATLMLALFSGGMLVFSYLLTRIFGGNASTVQIVWISGCGLSLLIPLGALFLGARTFRSYVVPLADIMDAADAVAEGDFDVHVKARGSQDFRKLAHSFNRMTEELARTDQQRRNLTADVAHELRTPLHIIQGNLEGIIDGVYEPSAGRLEATLQETHSLARLVDDLATLSKAESGELPLHLEPVDVSDLLADAATSFSPQAEAAGITIRVDPPSEPRVMQADPGRMDQVMGNLVSNAIRHTSEGGTVTLAAEPMEGSVRIKVTDTGEGIPAEDLPYIFDRFWRGDPARTRDTASSSGLGLAITNQLIRSQGGEITVASEVGAGTTFTIEMPIQ